MSGLWPRAAALILASLWAGGCRYTPGLSAATHTLPAIRVVHPFGEAFGAALTSTVKSIRIEATPHTNGSYIKDLLTLGRGEADAVFVYADIAYMASVGQIDGLDAPLADARAIAQMPGTRVQVVVPPGSQVRSISDLRHRRVAIGPSHSETVIAARFVLEAFGLSPADIDTREMPFAEAARQLATGDLDAAFWNSDLGLPNIANAIKHGARLLDISGPAVARLRAEYPFLKLAVVPAGTYPGLDQPIHTVGMDMTFVCRADLDEEAVHELARAFVEVAVTSKVTNQGLTRMNLSRAASTALPLHPGASRFYRERELLR